MPCDENITNAFSCGTWSLIGCESDLPILTEKSMNDGCQTSLVQTAKSIISKI
ncbi:MAG: hypothetical protein ACLR6O_05685 [Eubacterium sp.]